ncbi:MAG TPA: gas vesicle protein GvpG [Longimicrobiales bacterium]
MGILKHLLFWPVTGPMFLTEFAFDKVQGVVREELTDDTSIKAELMELQLMLELGDIDDDEYVRREAEVMAKLRDVRHWREQFGMGVSGGPVRVQSQGGEGVTQQQPAADMAADAAAGASESAQEAVRKPPEVVDAAGGATIDVNFDWE